MAAFIRSLSTRSNLVRRQYSPSSFSYILHHNDDDRKDSSITEVPPSLQGISSSSLLQQRGCGNGFISHLSNNKIGGFSPSTGACFFRYMSTIINEGTGKIELTSDVLTDSTAQAVANPAVNEVAVAAADSFFPVALLQHFIDSVHIFTGLNWAASIVLATLLIRGAILPLQVNQLKSTSKLSVIRPRLEEIKQQMENKGMDPIEGQKQMKLLFKEYGVNPLTPLQGIFIQGPIFISFFWAITNMVEKVPSFKSGGAFWFVDLTTTDTLYIFPVVTALTFLLNVECNAQEGLEGNPVAGIMKTVFRVFAVLSIPMTISFPNGIFCYWITSNLLSLIYGLVLKRPGVKKALGVPEIPVTPASTAPKSTLSLSSILKQAMAARQEPTAASPAESSPKISYPDISQRIGSLEKQARGRKKNKKR